MTLTAGIAAEIANGSPSRLELPERRQIELYSNRKALSFAPQSSALPLGQLAGAVRAFLLLDSFLKARLGVGEPMDSWPFYLSLPRSSGTDKIVAQLYRVLRIARTVLYHPQGGVEMQDGVARIKGIVGRSALSLDVSLAGLTLMESAVSYYVQAAEGPYPEAYVEAMLGAYYFDIIDQTKGSSDEGRALYQFRHSAYFCRHFRLECSNPKIKRFDTEYEIEIGAPYADPARYPIDFFIEIEGRLHIVPTEALKKNRITTDELEKWRAVTPDGITLPADFRTRFAREDVLINQPMS